MEYLADLFIKGSIVNPRIYATCLLSTNELLSVWDERLKNAATLLRFRLSLRSRLQRLALT